MIDRFYRVAGFVIGLALIGWLKMDVILAEPPSHAAPAADHAANIAPPAESARSVAPPHPEAPMPAPVATPANRPAANVTPPAQNGTAPNDAAKHTDQGNRRDHDGEGDHRHPDRLNGSGGYYYPLGYGYDYWNSNWYPYNYGPDYPGQFVQGGADQSTAAESAGAPSSVDTLSPTPTTAASVPDSALLASPQWRDADAQVRIAQGKYDAAVEVVKTKLRSEPAYQAALLSKERDAQQLAAIQSKNPAPSIDRTAPAATAKLDAAETITRMESAAIQADPQASAAKSDLDAAIAHRDEIGRAVDATVPRPALNPAR